MAEHTSVDDAPFGTYAPDFLLRAILDRTTRASTGWLDRRAVFALRKLGVVLLGGKPADVERLGCRFRLYPAHNTAEKRLLFTPHLFDAEERAYLAAHLAPDCTFADIGANVGGYALFVAAATGPKARILAVEPQPDVFARLATNVRQSDLVATITPLNCAVSDHDGDVSLHINPTNKGESSMLSNGSGKLRMTVMAYRLGRLLEEAGFPRLDALKLDVEGVEDRILKDLFSSTDVRLWPTILIVENGPTRWSLDVAALIRGNGYEPVLQTTTNLLYRRDVPL